jgi:hypothetical protein
VCVLAFVPSHETWFISSWIPPLYVESKVVSSELGRSHNRVSILFLLLILSQELILLLIRPEDTLLWTVQNHSSLQVRY